MKSPSQMSRTSIMVEGALMIALAFVLSTIRLYELPWGGSITCFSTLPIILMSFRHSVKWGVGTATIYGFTQMLYGMKNVAAAGSAGAMFLCAMLDYIIAYACIGLAGAIGRRFRNGTAGMVVGILGSGLLRLFCSFLSGIIIWGTYAPEGTPVWVYSLTYNAGWLLPDLAIVLVAAILLAQVKALHILPEKTPKTV